ncbi:MAG: hypothetical protein H8E37_07345 [Planctomycetes bacterium]|nr:hypothetical protein [Planctomycetota bacterium]
MEQGRQLSRFHSNVDTQRESPGTYAGSGVNAVQTAPANSLDDGPGSLTVLGRIIDKNGGFTDYTTAIWIRTGSLVSTRV